MTGKKEGKGEAGAKEEEMKILEKRDGRLRRFHPRGAILRVDLDGEDWLTGGLPAKVPAILYTDEAFIARDPVRTVGRFAEGDSLHLSGLLWPEAAGRWARTAYCTREGKGRGQIILFAGDPIFRGYFRATQRLLLNAVLLGPGLGTSRPTPW